jgi:pimeloyl-ACP methyl ester carboxylesterase
MRPAARHEVVANGIRQSWIEQGDGPAVVLLHGFPETNLAWRHQLPVLAGRYRVIAPDLRGYGRTEKPYDGYDKRTMANDLAGLLDHLGLGRVALVGHDRGARVATRFAKDHRDRVDRLVVMDNVPTRVVADRIDARIARAYWFFLFHQVPDLPEALITGREEEWLRWLFSDWTYDRDAIEPETFAAYLEAYRTPGALRGSLSDYRANREDVAQDRADAHVRIACPTMALWGADFEPVGGIFEMEEVWRELAEDLRTAVIGRCGHLPHEERPAEVNALLIDFLAPWDGGTAS